jgi:putative endonuclease
MFTVYVLYAADYQKIYIGYTSNLEERLKSHNHLGKKGYTTKYRPWRVAMKEEYSSKSQALNREKFLKSGRGRKLVWNKISSLGLISA